MKELAFIKRSNGQHWVGDGFPVRSIFSYNDIAEEMSPFLLMDYAGPANFPATSHQLGVGQHPHQGLVGVDDGAVGVGDHDVGGHILQCGTDAQAFLRHHGVALIGDVAHAAHHAPGRAVIAVQQAAHALDPADRAVRADDAKLVFAQRPAKGTGLRGNSRIRENHRHPIRAAAVVGVMPELNLDKVTSSREQALPAERLFTPGEQVQVAQGPFAGIEAIYQTTDAERRSMILLYAGIR